MRKISLTIPFIMVFFVAVFYVGNLFSNTESSETIAPREWSLNSLCDIKVMNLESESITYSDIQKALLSSKLKSGSLPVSLEISMNSSEAIEGLNGAKFRLSVNGINVENTLENIKVSEKSLHGVWNCDLAKLYNGSNEEELIIALKDLTTGQYNNCEIMADFKNHKINNTLWTKVATAN